MTLGDIGRVVTGKTPSTARDDFFGGTIPFVTPTDMDGRRIISETQRSLTEEGALSVKGSSIPPESVMVSCIGSQMGKSAIAGRSCVTNQQINSIVVASQFSAKYVYYNLSLRAEEIRLLASGSAVPILSKSKFEKLPISVPTLPEQRAIAHILGTLDDKIELNRRMNATLESMARALFMAWFVDFEPVRAKAEGRDPGLPPHLAELFPTRLVKSELGEVPEGWEIKSFDKIADFLNGLALQKYPPEGDDSLPVIKIAQMRKGNTEGADRASASIDSAYVVNDGDVLFSWSGSLEAMIWCGGKGALNQHLFKVTSAEYPKWFYFHWVLFHLPDFQEVAAGKATTMGHIQRHHLADAKVLVPSARLLQVMDAHFTPLLDRFVVNQLESRTLAALRDALLPKLVSGELRVRDLAGEFEVKERSPGEEARA